jgi:hypothetical protein
MRGIPAGQDSTSYGLGQIACTGVDDPCTEVFIGDYLGLAVSDGNIYGLFVSTHYPSSVRADEGGKAALGAALCFNSDSRLGDLGART